MFPYINVCRKTYLKTKEFKFLQIKISFDYIFLNEDN